MNKECVVCQSGGKGPCQYPGVTYSIACKSCDNIYIGETARNARVRGREHADDHCKKSDASVLHRHAREKHPGEEAKVEFMMSVTGMYRDAMSRQIAESVLINRTDPQQLINNKSEFNSLHLPGLALTQDGTADSMPIL